MLSNCILVPFANNYEWALWLGSALMGFGCSSVFATMFGFMEQLTPVTARITSGFMIAGGFQSIFVSLTHYTTNSSDAFDDNFILLLNFQYVFISR